MNWSHFFKVCLVLILASECFGAVPAPAQPQPPGTPPGVDSPIVKEIEQKKALYYRKPPQGKNLVLVPKKPIRAQQKVNGSAGASRSINGGGGGGGGPKRAAIPVSKRGPGHLRNPSSIQQEILRKQHQSKQEKQDSEPQTAASDRTFFPPYKYPFWGMPYGIYSNGGFINPGLFPFVPGGPGFPPYDGIFGSPFGPGLFPGKQNPIPDGVGTPMVPAPAAAAPGPGGLLAGGQPPLNPTGNRRGPPPGAYSPGSPVGYKKSKSKPKAKPKPKPAEADSDCPCSKHKEYDEEEDYTHAPTSRPSKNHKSTPASCPCRKPKPPKRKKVVYHHYDDEDDDEDDKPTPVCPYAHEPEPQTSTTPAYSPPPAAPTYAATTPPAPPPAPTEAPYQKKPRVCKLKHKTKSVRYADGTTVTSRDYPTKEAYASPPPPPPPAPEPEAKKPCPLRTQKSVEYIYITQPPTTTTSTTTTTSPPPTYPSAPLPPNTYQQQQPAQSSTYQQPAQSTNYLQQSAPAPSSSATPVYQQQDSKSQSTTYLQPADSQPAAYQQASPQTTTYQTLSSAGADQQQQTYQAATVTPPAVVYSTPSTDQATSGSHNTVLYKPVPTEIIHTPTSVTVPLPLPPFMIDSKGQLVQQTPSQSPQQVTYKLDLNPDLLSKITTPVMIQSRQASMLPLGVSPNQSLRQILTAGNGKHYIVDNQPIAVASSIAPTVATRVASQLPPSSNIYPQSRVLIVDNVPQPSPITYSSSPAMVQPSSMSSVVVLNSDSMYDLIQSKSQQQSQPSTVQYVQPQQLSSSGTSSSPIYLSPSVQSVPDYSYLVPETQPQIRSHYYKTPSRANVPYPYRYSPSPYEEYEEEVRTPPRRPAPQNNYNNKDYVIIDRDELEELKRTLTTSDQPLYEEEDRNMPPPPELVHIDYHHSRIEDIRDDFNRPLAFSGNKNSPSWDNHRLDQSHYMRNYDPVMALQPHRSMASLFDPSKGTGPDGTKQFSQIFEMNNQDIRGVGPPGSRKKKKNKGNLVFDKYLENSEDVDDSDKK